MKEAKFYFRVREFGLMVGMEYNGEMDTDYAAMTRDIDKDALVEFLDLDRLGLTGNDIDVITPEEYKQKFGEGGKKVMDIC